MIIITLRKREQKGPGGPAADHVARLRPAARLRGYYLLL